MLIVRVRARVMSCTGGKIWLAHETEMPKWILHTTTLETRKRGGKSPLYQSMRKRRVKRGVQHDSLWYLLFIRAAKRCNMRLAKAVMISSYYLLAIEHIR